MTYNVFGGTLNLAQSVKSTYVIKAHIGEMSTLPKLAIRHGTFSPKFLHLKEVIYWLLHVHCKVKYMYIPS